MWKLLSPMHIVLQFVFGYQTCIKSEANNYQSLNPSPLGEEYKGFYYLQKVLVLQGIKRSNGL